MSKRINVSGAVAAAAFAAISGNAGATVITLNLPLNQLLSAGQSHAGTFDLSSFLTPSKTMGHTLTNATVTAYGYSDAHFDSYNGTSYDGAQVRGVNYYQTGSYYVPGYYSWWGGSYQGYYIAYYASQTFEDVYRTDILSDTVADAMSVESGGSTSTGIVASQPATTSQYQYRNQTVQGNYYAGYTVDSNYGRTTSFGNYGALTAATALSAPDLTLANQNRLVDFTVASTTGTFHLQSVSLSANTQDFTIASVPEPTSWAMMVLGLGLTGAAFRRRKGSAAAATT